MASSGTLTTSASVRLMPSRSRACALTTAQVAMPPISTSSRCRTWPSAPRSRLVISLPVAIGVAVRVHLVRAQEHLVRGMRGVGLVLVDERRGGVLVLVDVVGGAENAVGTGIDWWPASAP